VHCSLSLLYVTSHLGVQPSQKHPTLKYDTWEAIACNTDRNELLSARGIYDAENAIDNLYQLSAKMVLERSKAKNAEATSSSRTGDDDVTLVDV
jgi:hypothetical protein